MIMDLKLHIERNNNCEPSNRVLELRRKGNKQKKSLKFAYIFRDFIILR